MKILHINTTDIDGGAAIAAHRLHLGLKKIGMDSKMLVNKKLTDEYSIIGPKNATKKIYGILMAFMDRLLMKLLKTNNASLHSFGLFSSIDLNEIARLNPDVINLHWICKGFVSPSDLKKINKPIIWTLHDMWAFSGTEHYTNGDTRYKDGYTKYNRPKGESGLDLNMIAWNRKLKAWKNLNNLIIVAPSNWMAKCASESILFKNSKVTVIPNGIDTSLFKPLDKKKCRKILNIQENKKIILFGAEGSTNDPRKGFKYLNEALVKMSLDTCFNDFEIIIFGSSEPEKKLDIDIPIHYLGRIHDSYSLAIIYSASDIFITPSIEDNLPNTILESMSCGTPVIAFNIGGIPDMIIHKETGYLVKPFEVDDLLRGINFILEDKNKYNNLSIKSRDVIQKVFSLETVSKKYADLYKSFIEK